MHINSRWLEGCGQALGPQCAWAWAGNAIEGLAKGMADRHQSVQVHNETPQPFGYCKGVSWCVSNVQIGLLKQSSVTNLVVLLPWQIQVEWNMLSGNLPWGDPRNHHTTQGHQYCTDCAQQRLRWLKRSSWQACLLISWNTTWWCSKSAALSCLSHACPCHWLPITYFSLLPCSLAHSHSWHATISPVVA